MAQFTVYRNDNSSTQEVYPLLLVLQSGLLASLTTRVVVPLCLASTIAGDRIKTLMPIFDIAGQRYVMLRPQLADLQTPAGRTGGRSDHLPR